MKKFLLFAAALLAVVNVKAQTSPVGILSGQDTVKSVQFGVISSVAINGGKGLQFGTFSNVSGAMFSGLQLSGINNITHGMNKGLQLSPLLNVSSGKMNGWQMGAINYADSLNGAQIGVFNVARKRPSGYCTCPSFLLSWSIIITAWRSMESASQRVECALTWFSTSVQQLFIISLLVSLPVPLL